MSFETKYLVEPAHVETLARFLELRCRPDPDHARYSVSSVYFDTDDRRLVDEKRNSDRFKAKVRARWYGDFRTGEPVGNVWLEVKRKAGAARGKRRVALDWSAARAAATPLASPEWRRALAELERAGVESIPGLRPELRVDYRRRRWRDPTGTTGICLDHSIRPAGRILPVPTAVLEIKAGSRRLPATLAPLLALGCRPGTFSKYLACHDLLGDP